MQDGTGAAVPPPQALADDDDLEERVTRETAAPVASPDLVPLLGANLRRLRVKRGLSLERLAKHSGVSRAMLSQIELGYSAPTINVIWRIAHALDLPFGALFKSHDPRGTRVLRGSDARTLSSHDGTFRTRALFPFDTRGHAEFYELRISPGAVEHAEAHPPGTSENLVVAQGCLHVQAGDDKTRLETGDAMVFVADVPHVYQNPGTEEAVVYLVMTYAERMRD